MRLVVLHNPIAGSGRARVASQQIVEALAGDGHIVTSLATTEDGNDDQLRNALTDADVLIIVGGDGTVRQSAGPAVETQTPIYQFPFGTENLFAREFGMNRDLDMLRRSIERCDAAPMDVGEVNGERFLMMVSVGFDAEVIHDLARRRTGGISHFSYFGPIVRSFFRWRPRPVEIFIDGSPLETAGAGITVVASGRQYAFRFDPVPHAAVDDGLLHVVHMPVCSKWGLALLALKARLRRHLRDPKVSTGGGREVTIRSDVAQRVQVDGDAFTGDADDHPLDLRITIRPAALLVLRPVPAG